VNFCSFLFANFQNFSFIFHYMYFHTTLFIYISHSSLFSFWDHFSIFNFHKTFLLDKWGKIIMYLYALPNHQQNQGYQHLHWTKLLTFFPLTRCKRWKKQIYGFAIEKQFLQLENKHPHQSFPKKLEKGNKWIFFYKRKTFTLKYFPKKMKQQKQRKTKETRKKSSKEKKNLPLEELVS